MLLGFDLLFFVFQYLKNYIHLIHDEVLILVKEDTQIIVPSYKYPNQSVHSHIKGNPLVFFLFFHHVVLHSKLENHLIRLLFGLLELFRHFTRGSQLILDSILIILNVIDLILQQLNNGALQDFPRLFRINFGGESVVTKRLFKKLFHLGKDFICLRIN